jgi:hypothetical protein
MLVAGDMTHVGGRRHDSSSAISCAAVVRWNEIVNKQVVLPVLAGVAASGMPAAAAAAEEGGERSLLCVGRTCCCYFTTLLLLYCYFTATLLLLYCYFTATLLYIILETVVTAAAEGGNRSFLCVTHTHTHTHTHTQRREVTGLFFVSVAPVV